jgi:hypothetical protein
MYISSIGINHLWNHPLLDCVLSVRFSYGKSAFGVRTVTHLSVAHPRAKKHPRGNSRTASLVFPLSAQAPSFPASLLRDILIGFPEGLIAYTQGVLRFT